MSDELRDRIRRLDPMGPDVDTRPVSQAREMMEAIMSTQTPQTPQTPQTERRSEARSGFRPAGATPGSSIALSRPLIPVMAGLVAVAIAAFALFGGGSPAPLALSAGDSDPSLMSCLPFSVDILSDMEVAFEGTVTDVDGDVLTLDVVTWFTGGDAEQVTITAPLGMEALIGGIPFETGESYLVTATNGVVNYCGYTAVATPEMRQAFESAF